jgi:ferritin-like metal-binding protein YciE
MQLPTLAKLLDDQLKDCGSAESQLTKALPKMAKNASDDGLKKANLSYLEKTKDQVGRLSRIGESLRTMLSGEKSNARMTPERMMSSSS